MVSFFTTNYLYTSTRNDLDFLRAFCCLTEFAQRKVLEKNHALMEFIKSNSEIISQVKDELYKEAEKKNEVKDAVDTDVNSNVNSVIVKEEKTDDKNEINNVYEVNDISNDGSIEIATENKLEKDKNEDRKYSIEDYNKLNFNTDIVYVNKVFISLLEDPKGRCPRHTNHKLKNQKLVVKNKGKPNKKITLLACDKCKRFYSIMHKKDITNLKRLEIEFEIIEQV